MKKLLLIFIAISFTANAQDLAGAGAFFVAMNAKISQTMVEACPTHFAIKNKASHDSDMKLYKKLEAEGKTMSASDAAETKAKMAKDCNAVNKQSQEKNSLKNITYKKPL
jgi:hypothetical protein